MIRALLGEFGEVSSGSVAEVAGVTRQAAHYHLRRMTEAGEVAAVGEGRGRRYVLRSTWAGRFDVAGLQEDRVWRQLVEDVAPVGTLPKRRLETASYAFTEMLNNAIDHSGADDVGVSVLDSGLLRFEVFDAGIGAFERVRRTKRLGDHVEAIQEIAKGKVTTDPSRHSGQGIFFTSKAVDIFELTSNGWRWTVDNVREDQAIARARRGRGTHVAFVIDPAGSRSLGEVFDAYTDPDTLEFDKTTTVVRLFEYGVSFVSRSEAKRLTRNLEQFREVVVDFHRVDGIGQGFADEVFRVWQSEHPGIRLVPVNMNEAVRFFVSGARARYQEANATSPR